GTDRTDVGEELEVLLEPVDLTRLRHTHAALRTFEHRSRIHLPALAQAREFAESGLEDALDAGDLLTVRGDLAEQAGQVGAGPETLLELVGAAHGPAEHRLLAEDDDPRGEREHDEQTQDELDRQARAEHQHRNIEVAIHA